MEIILEQFIPSDRPKRISNILKNIAIAFGAVAIITIFGSLIIGIAAAIIALVFFCWKLFNVCGLWIWII